MSGSHSADLAARCQTNADVAGKYSCSLMLAVLVLGVQGLCYLSMPLYRLSKAELKELDDVGGMGECFVPPVANWVSYSKYAQSAISRVSVRALNGGDSFLSPPAPLARWLSKGENDLAAERGSICPKATASLLCPKHTGNFLCQ